MSDTNSLDVKEQVDFLFKNYLGFPNTDETKPYFNETNVKANNYVLGEDIFLSNIPKNPNFNSSKTSTDVNLTDSDFNSYSSTDSIVDDSTGLIRKFVKLKLTPVPGSSDKSYYKLDSNGDNVLADSIQFNKNKDGSTTPYLYKLYSSSGVSTNDEIPNTSTGGNWIFDIKNGIINFPDTPSATVNSSNPPYLTFYKYVGRKGLSLLSSSTDTNIADLSTNVFSTIDALPWDVSSNGKHLYVAENIIDYNIGIGIVEPNSKLEVVGDISASQNLYVKTNIGINKVNPNIAFYINSTDSMKIPVGTTGERPGAPETGMLRYNNTTKQFEGYSNSAWQGLGGVVDIPQTTKITAANSVDDQDKRLRFFTDGSLNMIMDESGNVGIGRDISHVDISFNNNQNFVVIGDVSGSGTAYFGGNVGIGITNATSKLEIVGDISSSQNLYVKTNIGINKVNPNIAFYINSTDSMKIPVGTTVERPGAPETGMLRYNNTTKQFEGYSNSAWQGLGGVVDIPQTTKITAPNSVDDQDKRLRFFTDGSLNMIMDESGNVGIGRDIELSDVSFNNNQNFVVVGDISASNAIYVPTPNINDNGTNVTTTEFVQTKISTLSSESVRDITSLDSKLSTRITNNISTLSSESVRDISTLSSESVRDITSLDSKLSTRITNNISTLSSESVRDISTLSSESVRDITSLDTKLSTRIADEKSIKDDEVSSIDTRIGNFNTNITDDLSTKIATLSSESVRDISDLSNVIHTKLSTDISTLSSESVRDISTLSSESVRDITSLDSKLSTRITNNISTLSSESVRDITSLDTKLSTRITNNISTLSSESVRDISTLSSESVRDITSLDTKLSTRIANEKSIKDNEVSSIDTRIDNFNTTITDDLSSKIAYIK